MLESWIREARRIKMHITSGRAAIRELRDLRRDQQGRDRKEWRLLDLIDIALDDAENHSSWFIDRLEKAEEAGLPSGHQVEGRRLGGIRMTFVRAKKRGEEPLFCPMVYCDACGEVIEGCGNVLYEIDKETHDVKTGEMFFFHKTHDRPFEAAMGGRWYWDELNYLPVRLAANIGLRVRSTGDRRWSFERRSGQAERELKGAAVEPAHTPTVVSVRLDPQRAFSTLQREELYLRGNGHCAACGVPLDSDWHADHIVPHSRGGRTEVSNGQALCQPCNSRKSAKVLTVDE